MARYQSVRILLALGMLAVLCGAVSAAGMGIIAETHETSAGNYPACPTGYECISESAAIQKYGESGYDKFGKTVCGQDANAYMQYYCFRPLAGSSAVSSPTATCQAPCECLAESAALMKWGTNGYTQCSKTPCARDQTTGGEVPRYCFKQWVSTVNVAGATTAAPLSPAVTSPAQPPAATPAAAAPSYTWPAADATPQKTPLGLPAILAAIGLALATAGLLRRQ